MWTVKNVVKKNLTFSISAGQNRQPNRLRTGHRQQRHDLALSLSNGRQSRQALDATLLQVCLRASLGCDAIFRHLRLFRVD